MSQEASAVSLPHVSVSMSGFKLEVAASQLSSGTVLGLFGHSGSGKTTYASRLYDALGPHNAAFLPQQDSLLEDITASQNILLASDSTLTSAELGDRVQRHANFLDLTDRLDHFARRLSGGERRRALLIRAFAARTRILILDEPFVGLGWRDEIRAREFVHRNRTSFDLIMIISHSADLLWSLSDIVWVMNEGSRIAEIKPQAGEPPQGMTLELADSLGVTNILDRAYMEDICEAGTITSEPSPLPGKFGFWIDDSTASNVPLGGKWQICGKLRNSTSIKRYNVRGRRMLEVRSDRFNAPSPVFLMDCTSPGSGGDIWFSVKSLISLYV